MYFKRYKFAAVLAYVNAKHGRINKKQIITIDVHFPGEKNTRLPLVLFHHHSPLHNFNVTNISVKLNRMQCKQSDFVS